MHLFSGLYTPVHLKLAQDLALVISIANLWLLLWKDAWLEQH